MWRRIVVAIVLVAQVAGCANTKERLEREGIEVESGKVKRVFRF
jgi:hypothetical protein